MTSSLDTIPIDALSLLPVVYVAKFSKCLVNARYSAKLPFVLYIRRHCNVAVHNKNICSEPRHLHLPRSTVSRLNRRTVVRPSCPCIAQNVQILYFIEFRTTENIRTTFVKTTTRRSLVPPRPRSVVRPPPVTLYHTLSLSLSPGTSPTDVIRSTPRAVGKSTNPRRS